MRMSRSLLPALPASAIVLLIGTAAAFASGPATGTVRVEGVSATLLPATTVTTNTAPVVNDGMPAHACEGTSALGALQDATGGNWVGEWSEKYAQYFINGIAGETHLYQAGVRSYYWSFWLNDVFQETGPCGVQLEAGDRVLFFPICDELCPAGPEPTPLEIEAPTAANTGEAVNVTVKQYSAKGEPSPAANASLTWPGGSTTTDSQGHATVAFGTAGVVEVHVTGSESGPPATRTETSICVHDGNDGRCGTQSSQTSTGQKSPGGEVNSHTGAPYHGPFAVVSRFTNVIDGHVYPRRHAPRLLEGVVSAHTAVTSVSLELRRTYRGRCWAYNGITEQFKRARCGRGSFFVVAHRAAFSYLLPAALAPGRYVLDVDASDSIGNRTTLARGTSRIVFYVRR
jgi:hypothetical protein